MFDQQDEILYFKGNQFASIGIIPWVFLLLTPPLSYLLDGGIRLFVAFLLVFTAMLMLISRSFNYFGTSTYYLMVKNHNWLWRRRKFYFDEIKEIAFDKIGNENGLVVITNNDKKHTFRAETLRDRHWVALKATLAQRGFQVTDEENIGKLVTPGMKMVNRIMRVVAIVYTLLIGCCFYALDEIEVGSTKRILCGILFVIMLVVSACVFIILYLWLCGKYDDSGKE